MSTLYNAVDLNALPMAEVLESKSFDDIFREMLVSFQEKFPEFNAKLESDPVYKLLEVAAYREMLVRQRVNDAARATMLAYATGADLDNLAALVGVKRKVYVEEDKTARPPVDAVLENDDDLKKRILLAPEAITTAGSTGSYKFHALNAKKQKVIEQNGKQVSKEVSAGVYDVAVKSLSPGVVTVAVLLFSGANETDRNKAKQAVVKALNTEKVRPLTDSVMVQVVNPQAYSIKAVLKLKTGAIQSEVKAKAEKMLKAYAKNCRKLGETVAISGIYSALHKVQDVVNAELKAPTQNLSAVWNSAYELNEIKIDFK